LRLRHWRIRQHDDGVLVLAFDRAGTSTNTFSRDTLIELDGVLERLRDDPPAAVVVASDKPNGFAAGADIGEFRAFDRKGAIADVIRRGQAVFQRLAELPCPTVAAIHGFCMGGGTELALACRYRIASTHAATRIGLPEVKLGIYPGWGGSVRLPALVGAAAAFDLMLSGRSLGAAAARALGLVDQTSAPDILIEAARHLALNGCTRPFRQRLLGWAARRWTLRQVLAPILLRQVARKLRKAHYPAPYALLETWRDSGGDVHARLAAERRSVTQLAATDTARNLVRVFFLRERLKHLAAADTPQRGGIEHVHVIGAGTMGADIAAWAAYKGFQVTLSDSNPATIDAAQARAQALFERRVKDTHQRADVTARLRSDPSAAGAGAATADLVIEAIIERSDAKRALYAQITPVLKPDALLVSNTSSIPLDALRGALAYPERFAGLHFFNPVALMPLVEIVRHDGLDVQAQQRLAAFCTAIGKLPLLVRGTPGFLVNRLLFAYLLEAVRAWSEGVPGVLIDRAALAFGMPVGPIELIDVVGLDVAAGVAAELAPFLQLSVPEMFVSPPEAGRRGKKDGRGLYLWQDGKAVKPEVPKDCQAPEDLQERLILPLINEAVAALHEGVVEDADWLDAGMIFGAGFAPFRGGPIQYVRQSGRERVLARLSALQSRHGERFAPRPGWDNPALLEAAA